MSHLWSIAILAMKHFHAMIFNDLKHGLNFHQSHENLVIAVGDEAPSFSTVLFLFQELQRERRSLED